MAITGPPPLPDEDRVRRNAPLYSKVPVKWDGVRRGPNLPKDIGVHWCPRTQAWWDVWRDSPQAMVMTDTDWESMLETAYLHHEFWSPKIVMNYKTKKLEQVSKSPAELKNIATELRARVAAFGATFEDRLKLRMQIMTPQLEQAEAAQIAQEAEAAVNYAEMLNKEASKKRK